MADLPAAASFTRPRSALRLREYSWTQNSRQDVEASFLFRAPLIGNIPARRRLRDYDWSCNLGTTTLQPANQSPFIGVAYPAPRGALRARDYGWSVSNLLQSTLQPAQVDPMRPPEFPPPRKPLRAREYGWSVNLLQGTLKPAPETQILRVAVVARPRARKPFDYGFIGNNNILILGEPLFPVEWDAPERAKRLHDYSWTPEVSALLLPEPVVVPEPTVSIVVDTHDGGKKRDEHYRKQRASRERLRDQIRMALDSPQAPEIIPALEAIAEPGSGGLEHRVPMDRLLQQAELWRMVRAAAEAYERAIDEDDDEVLTFL